MDHPAPPKLLPADAGAANCANCGAARLGKFCQNCGQHEDTAHHSIRRLLIEAAEHLLNTDGKTCRTLRGILLSPASLTRDYLAGKRAAQLAPLQLFFVMLVLFLFIADHEIVVEFEPFKPAQAAALPHWFAFLYPVGQRIQAHGGSFLGLLRQSAEAFGLLMAPVAALLLWGLYAGRGWRLYDHIIFALHALSFLLVILGINLLLPDSASLLMIPLTTLVGVHLFVHLRGCYGGGVIATLARMLLLVLGTVIAYAALSILWIASAYLALS